MDPAVGFAELQRLAPLETACSHLKTETLAAFQPLAALRCHGFLVAIAPSCAGSTKEIHMWGMCHEQMLPQFALWQQVFASFLSL